MRILLLTGKVLASVEDRHRSREFIGFLKRLDAAYPADTAIKVILDNHSAHISKETKAWVANQPEGRFSLVFTPKHGSWLLEGFFSKMARSMLRHIRVPSKAELKAWILAYLDDLNHEGAWLTLLVIPLATLSSVPGPTNSGRPRDRSRSLETLF
jgi:transposase